MNLINRTPVANRFDNIRHGNPNVWPETLLLSSFLYNYKLPRFSTAQFTPKHFLSSSLPMAALTVSISSAKTDCAKAAAVKAAPSLRGVAARGKTVKVRSSVRENVMKMAAASAAGVALASSTLVGSAAAIEILMGSSDGSLVFIPKEFSVAAGEPIVFKNNAGFPHNIIFDEDAVPSGVDVSTLSMGEEDLLNAPGQTYTVKLEKPGIYGFYCSPHQGSGMSGTVTVN